MSDNENDLFNIHVSSDESANEDTRTKVPRDFQSEADFQAVLRSYRPKVEIGEVCRCFRDLLISATQKTR